MTAKAGIHHLICPYLREFKAYSSARTESSGGEIFLDANELSLGCSADLSKDAVLNSLSLNRYPDPEQKTLRERLGHYWKVGKEHLFIGNGSDEVIDLLVRLFCESAKDSILVTEPTYGVYRVAADLNHVSIQNVELKADFSPDFEKIRASISAGVKIIFFCSPNNPTGLLIDPAEILRICESFDGIVVVDQAYVEFSKDVRSLIDEVPKRSNLVLLRTFSKAWGLAGARLGYAVASPEIVSYLTRIKPPYNVNAVSGKLGLMALDEEEKEGPRAMSRNAAKIKANRAELQASLAKLKCVVRVHPSEANYLLAEVTGRDRLYEALFREGIVVRRRSEPRLKNFLRFTIGTEEENAKVISILEKVNLP